LLLKVLLHQQFFLLVQLYSYFSFKQTIKNLLQKELS